ncbi:hypothetical protein V1264_013816 [Littorina saxatilis]|uniref:Uncharacterized protein n=1 Tax=Littorina saxatilis TaxID=31220 RepID=A0AAN9BPK4_9CAEN
MDGGTATAKASYQRALQGCLTDLPKEESTTVRVFFSSTFTDMKVERNMLMKEAVSHLRDYCKDRGLDYEVVDMRWGVREDASVEHTTTDICRQEIANCRELSAGPNFVAFLGDRYGSRLLPSSIPVTEYRSLRRLASWMDVDDFGAVDKWYIVDTNAVPALYRIQPITDLLPHYNDFDPKHRIVKQQHHQTWDRDHGKMMNAFRVVAAEAHKRKMITNEEYLKYYISVTHREVIDGMVDIPGMNSLNDDRVLSFHRNFTDININDKIAKRFIDLTEEAAEDSEEEVKVDAKAEQLRQELKAEVVPSHLQGSNISENTIRWTEYGVYQEDPEHAAYLRTFCDVYMAKMMAMIDKCAQKKEVTLNRSQELYEEVVAHLRFCREKCRVFCGREQELQRIQASLVTTHTLKKESTAKVQETNIKQEKDAETDEDEEAQEEEDTEENDMYNEMDMCKMTGATFCYGDTFNDQESDPTRDLKEEHISMPEIKTFKRPVIIHGPTGSGKTALMAKVVHMSKRWVPGSVCVARFLSTTTSASYVRSTMISIIGQLLDLYGLHPPAGLDLSVDFHYLTLFFTALLWRIDSKTSPLFLVLDSVDQLQSNDYAHMLIWLPTMLPPNVHVFVSMSTDHPMCLRSALEVLPYEDQFIQLGGLNNNTADKIVRSLCHQVGRTLTVLQRSHVLHTFAESGQALHLTLITNQALSWRSHHKLSDLKLAGTVEAAIEQYFCELEKTHGHIFVSHLLGYFTLAKYGLTNGEIEDLLSLDDEVLQDSYIYHLPPDPHMIRIPTSLIVRVSDDLSTYITKQKSGERKISTWFHRQFKEAALRRYCTEDSTPVLHRAMADYFLGTWSTRPKPLELYKGKTGSYEDCLRGVPVQPLKYDGGKEMLFNVRKLQELPHHLAACGSWDEFHMLACDVEWLVAVCISLGVTHLQSQFSAMLNCDMDDIEDEEIKQKARDVLLVQSIINLGIDDIRRDTLSVPVQILGQLGPQYKGSAGIEGLLQQCREYLASYKRSVFMPQNAFMPAPGGLLLSTINLRNFLMGAERECGQSVCVDKSKHCLYAVEWSADRGTDSLLVLDYENTGVIMARQKLPFFIHSIELVTVNRFFVLKTYSKLSKYDPKFSYILFEGGFSAPYIFEKPVTAVAIASHGHLIAFSFKDDRTVHMGLPESKACKVQVKQHMYMDNPIAVLLFSPDASELVGVDVMGNISTYNTSLRQAVTLHTNTERLFGSSPKPHQFRITRSNVLLRVVHSLSKGNAVVALDLANQREMHRMSSEKLIYDFDIMELDEQEEYVVVCTKTTSIINGIRDRPGLMFRLSDGVMMSTIKSKESWKAVKLIGDETLFCVASYSSDGIIRVLNCGPRESPVAEPEIICELNDHSNSVFSLLLIQDNTRLVSSATDNTVKFWDMARILREKNLVEEEDKLAWNKKEEKKEGEKTGVEQLGKTTTVAVTG